MSSSSLTPGRLTPVIPDTLGTRFADLERRLRLIENGPSRGKGSEQLIPGGKYTEWTGTNTAYDNETYFVDTIIINGRLAADFYINSTATNIAYKLTFQPQSDNSGIGLTTIASGTNGASGWVALNASTSTGMADYVGLYGRIGLWFYSPSGTSYTTRLTGVYR